LIGTNQAAADDARLVADQAQLALEQVRNFLRGLFPVEIDAEHLLPALEELASTTEAIHGIRVEVEGAVPWSTLSSRVATQLYRIAQEAVNNAVKHARAHTIRVKIGERDLTTTLQVIDDGLGIQTGISKTRGLGLRIMRYRATTVGAQLSVDRGADGGTVVTCTVRQATLSSELEPETVS
jgi:signal transduction histidine kinase